MGKVSDFNIKRLEALAKEAGKSIDEMAEYLNNEFSKLARQAREKGEIPKDLRSSDFSLGHLVWLKDRGDLSEHEFQKEIDECRKRPHDTEWSDIFNGFL